MQAQNNSTSCVSKILGSSASSVLLTEQRFGEELDVHSLLVLDQHTFESEQGRVLITIL